MVQVSLAEQWQPRQKSWRSDPEQDSRQGQWGEVGLVPDAVGEVVGTGMRNQELYAH